VQGGCFRGPKILVLSCYPPKKKGKPNIGDDIQELCPRERQNRNPREKGGGLSRTNEKSYCRGKAETKVREKFLKMTDGKLALGEGYSDNRIDSHPVSL